MDLYSIWIEAEAWAPGQWNPPDDNSDVFVTFPSGNRWGAQFFSYANIASLTAKNCETGENLSGQFFWARDMLLVDEVSRPRIEAVIQHLISEGDFAGIFTLFAKDEEMDTESAEIEVIAAAIVVQIQALPDRTTDRVRAVRREFSQRLHAAPPETILALARRLLARPEFTYRFLAYELIAAHRATLRSLGPTELEELGQGLDSWEAVDTFASYLAGPAWRARQVPDALIHAWAASPDRWWRRAALVSTVALNTAARGGMGDPDRTLAVCALLVADRDDMVVKALSWALRELAKRDQAAVHAFLSAHAGQLAARVQREVWNKLATGLKNPRHAVRQEP